jgi:hypothetical protein
MYPNRLTPSPDSSPTPTPSNTPTSTPTVTPSQSACPGSSPSPTPSNTATPTITPSITPTITITPTKTTTPTPTVTPSSTPNCDTEYCIGQCCTYRVQNDGVTANYNYTDCNGDPAFINVTGGQLSAPFCAIDPPGDTQFFTPVLQGCC